MIHLGLSPATVNDLGWTLIHFLWQGALLAAILQAILPMCRDAAARHNWALAALAMMALAPILTFIFIHGHHGAAPAVMSANAISGLPAPMQFGWIDLLVACWLGGIAILTLRAIGGWYLVEIFWRRDSFDLPDDLLRRCQALKARLALSRPVLFLQSFKVHAPVVIGWLRPVILIPVSAVTGLVPQQLDALILHELAHIRRFDAFTNLVLILAETILFYHPAVWLVCRRVRIEREHACDDFAVTMCGDAGVYVEALTSLKSWQAMPAFALAASDGRLKERVARLLDAPSRSRKISPSAVIGLLFVCALAASAATAHDGGSRAAPRPPVLQAARENPARIAANGYSIAQAEPRSRRTGKKRQIALVPQPPQASLAAPEATITDQSAVPENFPDVQALPVSVPAPAPSATAAAVETIFVTAKKWLGREPRAAIREFVNSYTNPATMTVGEIARWKGAICAHTYGLARPEDEAFVTKRVEDIATDTGLTVKSGPCHYGIEIVFTARPQEFLDKVREKNASLLGSKPSQAEANPMRYPVQAWYATATRDMYGRAVLDNEDNAEFRSFFAGNITLPILSAAPIYNVQGSRFHTGLNSELAHIYIVADTSRLEGYPLSAVADYVAVLALSQTQNFDACRPMPSITNLTSPVCGDDLKPASLTDTDIAYLKAVYTMDPGASLQQQRSFIAGRIASALGVP